MPTSGWKPCWRRWSSPIAASIWNSQSRCAPRRAKPHPGFAGEILPRLGEPYVTSRPQGKARQALAAQIAAARPTLPGRKGRKGRKALPAATNAPTITPSQGGMGLGFFIARTLLERTGGTVTVGTGDGEKGQPRGARVAIRWPRPALEMPADERDTLTAGAARPS